jgi:F-type H+-transporting ATPase subunit epsilon
MSESTEKTFSFELVSPEEKLISEPATMVVVPGEEGDFGVLVDHSAVVSSIRPGVLEIHGANDNETRRIFVSGGFADVTPESCVVLAEEAVNVSDLNKDDLEQTIRNLTEDLGMVEGEADKDRVEEKLFIAKAKLSAVTGTLVI